MNGSVSQLVSVAACCLLLAGCASNPSYSSPVIDFAGISCDEQPDLSTAVSLEPKKQKKFIEVLVPVSDNAPCLATAKGNIPYELLALPMITENKMFEIGSAVEPLRFFSPRVSTLDMNGTVVRHFTREQLAFRGNVYSVQMRALDNGKYVLIKNDPRSVGKYFDNIQTSTSTSTFYTGFGVSSWTNGVDQNVTRAFSYEGTIIARTLDTSIKKDLSRPSAL